MSNPAELPGSTLSLFPPGELPEGAELLVPLEDQKARYPLTTVEKNQERLHAIVLLLGRNAPKKFICETFKVGWYTLAEIAKQHGDKITLVKKRSAQNLGMFIELGTEQMLEDLQAGRLDPDKLPINIAVAVDKLQLLTGDATMIVGSPADQGQRLNVESLKEKLAGMKRAPAAVQEAELVPTHSTEQGNQPTREPGSALPDARSDSNGL
jgi:hypothetical protein